MLYHVSLINSNISLECNTNKNCRLWCTTVVCHVRQLSTTSPADHVHRCDIHRVTKKDTET